MTKLISDNGGMKQYAQVTPMLVKGYEGWVNFKMYTTYDNSKDPTDQHIQLNICLDPQHLENLKKALNDL
jgi:hypothetical protein